MSAVEIDGYDITKRGSKLDEGKLTIYLSFSDPYGPSEMETLMRAIENTVHRVQVEIEERKAGKYNYEILSQTVVHFAPIADLVRALAARDSVKEMRVPPHAPYAIELEKEGYRDTGPARILVVTD